MDVPAYEDRHLALITLVAESLATIGQWPLFPYVEARLDHEHDLAIEDVLADIPDSTVFTPGGYGPQSTVIATVPALACAPLVADDLTRFLAVVGLAAASERRYVPPPLEQGQLLVPAADVIAAMSSGADSDSLSRLRAIVEAENVAFLTGDPVGEWSLSVDTRIRRYRDLTGIDDYIARRPAPQRPRLAPIAAVPLAPRIFILMPFGEAWSDNVSDAIAQACTEVATTVEGLSWARADDIAEPGRITDQIIAAIETADVIIADVTGNNPNVLFELGYADAVRKPIIVLNQELASTPFDIKDWRQIEYSTTALAAVREQLVTFVRGAIRARLRA